MSKALLLLFLAQFLIILARSQNSFLFSSNSWVFSNFLANLNKEFPQQKSFSDSSDAATSSGLLVSTSNTSSFSVYFGNNLSPEANWTLLNSTALMISIDSLKVSLFTHFSTKWSDGSPMSDGDAYGSIAYTVNAECNFDLADQITASLSLQTKSVSFLTEKMNPKIRSALSENFQKRSQSHLSQCFAQELQSLVDSSLKTASETIKGTFSSSFLNGVPLNWQWKCNAEVFSDSGVNMAVDCLREFGESKEYSESKRGMKKEQRVRAIQERNAIYTVNLNVSEVNEIQRMMIQNQSNSMITLKKEDYGAKASVFDFQLIDFDVYDTQIVKWGNLFDPVELNCSLSSADPPVNKLENDELISQFNQNWTCLIIPLMKKNETSFPNFTAPFSFTTSLVSSMETGFSLFVSSARIRGNVSAEFLSIQNTGMIAEILNEAVNRTTNELFTNKVLNGFLNVFPIFKGFLCPWPTNITSIEEDNLKTVFYC